MVNKEVVISITTIQNYGEEDTDTIEFTTDGIYSYEAGIARLSYFETEVTGLSGTKTSVLIGPEEIILDRRGSLTTHMVFSEGKKNSFVYDTPYGKATMGLRTGKIRQQLDENGGEVVIDYVLDMEHVAAVRNRFHLTIKEIQMNGAGIDV